MDGYHSGMVEKKPVLNKKNLIKFANNLYKETGEKIEYMPLCEGTLAKGNGEILHCALGELYEEFVGKVARRATKSEIKDYKGYETNPKDGIIYTHDYSFRDAIVLFKTDEEVVDELTLIANLKRNKAKFRIGLQSIPDINDKSYDEVINELAHLNDDREFISNADLYIERAKRVQKHLFKIANYLE